MDFFKRLLDYKTDKPLHFTRFCYLVYFVGFLTGTTTHTIDNIANGLFGYTNFHIALNIYWTSLTLLDPLSILLLILAPEAGLVLSAFVMISDLAVNYGVILHLHQSLNYAVICQLVFGTFLFATMPHVSKKLKTFRAES